MFETTPEGQAEAAKRRKDKRPADDDGKTLAHHAADGAAENQRHATRTPMAEHVPRRPKFADRHDLRHPDTGRYTPAPQHPILTDGQAADSPGNIAATSRPSTSWPGTEWTRATPGGVPVTQVGPPSGLPSEPFAVVPSSTGADHPERVMHGNPAVVERIDLTRGDTPRPVALPIQPSPFIAPNTPGE